MKKILFWLGMAISLGFVSYAVVKLDFYVAFAMMKTARLSILALSFAIQILAQVLTSYRWGVLLKNQKKVSTANLFGGISVGMFGNFVLPGRMGEVLRAYATFRIERVPFSVTLSTVAIDRLLDVMGLGMLTMVTLVVAGKEFLQPEQAAQLLVAAWIIGFLAMGSLMFSWWIAKKDSLLYRACLVLVARLKEPYNGKFTRLFEQLREVLKSFSSPSTLILTIGLTALIWAANVTFYGLTFVMFGYELTLAKACILTIFVALSVTIPSSPGWVGPMHAAFVFSLGLFGVESSQGLGIAIFFHLSTFLLWTALCATFLLRTSLSFVDLAKHAQAEDKSLGESKS